jgi:hypothetical protein
MHVHLLDMFGVKGICKEILRCMVYISHAVVLKMISNDYLQPFLVFQSHLTISHKLPSNLLPPFLCQFVPI